jgi:CheY-like chemotaxis protein
MMGGKIWVDSLLGEGATLSFSVPMERGPEAVNALLSSVNKEDVKLLVVDDDLETLEYLALLAERIGVACDVARSGSEALAMMQKGNRYNICFVDWRMPEMDGIELTRIMKTGSESDPVVIMISTNAWGEIEPEAKEAGVDGFLYKPLFPSCLTETINTHIGIITDEEENNELEQSDYFGDYHILVAEDMDINQEIVLAMLEPTMLKIDCAENGKIALDMFNAEPTKYSMIFMDIQMPEMDGIEATKKIRAMALPQAKAIPIIAMSANVFKEDVDRCLAAGMNDHLGKPIDIDEVLEKLRMYLIG